MLLLLTNIITTFSATSVFAFVNNSSKTENTLDELLKNVNFNETPEGTVNSTNTEYSNFWDLGGENQTGTNSTSWGTTSTQVVVGLSDTLGGYGKVEQFALMENGQIVDKVLMGGKVEAAVVNIPSVSLSSFVTEVKEDGLSKYVEPSVKYQAFMVPNNPYWSYQWGPQKIQAPLAWNITTGNKRVLVCVVDTGIDYNHPDLKQNYVPLGYNWVSNNWNVSDDFGHGTHCAGIIAAAINSGVGIAGLANVRIMAEKGLDAYGSGYDYNLANAIINATDAGANIISMSWGGSSPSRVIEDALKYAYNRGVLLVAAAGNSGSSAKSYPAAYPEVVAVTATDSNDQPAYFTSYGDWVELAAPGVNIYSTMPTYHVTMNDMGYSMNYSYMSGTSMACPHVVGVAALIWSEFPTMSRDALRLRLRYTADEVGTPGFDIYYGYGRVNAFRALSQSFPAHDILILSWEKPTFIEPNATGMMNATIVNYGSNNETNVNVQWLINGSLVQSSFVNMTSESSTVVSVSWTPTIVGNYNVTVYVVPVLGETNAANNIVQGYLYVGIPLKAFVLRSAGTELVTDAWDELNDNWQMFGNKLIYIDYTTLDKSNITYSDLNATKADVLIISCAYMWEYSDSEIAAIEKYVYEGHGFIVTAGTFYSQVPNNSKFAPILGMNGSNPNWGATYTDLLDILQPSHPLFAGVPNPYTMPFDYVSGSFTETALPSEGVWSSNELAGGTYVAMGYNNESAIVTYRGLVYISPWLESIPERYKFNLQILYNAIIWSRYQKPQHELTTTLQVPKYMFPNSTITINATVTNNGIQNESGVDFQLSIRDPHGVLVFSQRNSSFTLPTGTFYTIAHLWNPTTEGVYNVTAYAYPVLNESNVADNKVTVFVNVTQPLIHPQEGTWARYLIYAENSTGTLTPQGEFQLNYFKYVSLYEMNVTLWENLNGYGNMTGWTIVNIFDRSDESGVWQNLWFPGMIQTNITTVSLVNVLYGPATVVGSKALVMGRKIADCWVLSEMYGGVNFTFWYDKTEGLWLKLEETVSGPYGGQSFIIALDTTNIPVGFPLEHELSVTLEAPRLVEFGNSSLLNATVYNLGMQNETNVKLQFLINGSIVASNSSALAVNASRTISYAWKPPSPGKYNVTAYAPPIAGEKITSNNIATAWVKVVVLKGRVLFDQTHGTYSIGTYGTWISNLNAEGFIVDTLSTGTITSGVLARYNAFVTIGAYSYYTSSEIAAIRAFVANGGGLLVGGGANPDIYTNLTSFANISWTYGGWGGTTYYIYPHEVTRGVNSVFLISSGNIISGNTSAQVLIRDLGFNIALAVNWYKGGRVLGFADPTSLNDYFIGGNFTDNLRLAINMIPWLCEKDTTPPEITFVSPANGTIIGTTTAELSWNATDLQSGVDHYSVYRNSQFVANTTAQSYNLSDLAEGANNVTIVAYDKAGNHASRSIVIKVDITLRILTPANNSYVRQAVLVSVSGSVANYTHMNLLIDSQLVALFSTSGENTYLWNTSAEQYGVYRITLIGYDSAGNSANVSITVTVDNLLPTASIVSPANATYVRGNIKIIFIAQATAIKNASIIIDATHVYDVAGMTSLTLNTTLFSDGVHTVKLSVYDLAGNEAETFITLTIDNTPPTVHITSPANNTYLKGTAEINFTFSRANLDRATLSLGGQAIDATGSSYYSWNTTTTGDGKYLLILTVSDRAGNIQTSEITVTVDNTLPVGEISSPLNSTTHIIRSIDDIVFYGYDTNLVNMRLYIDGISVPQTWNTSGTHDHPWDTSTVSDGLHTITLTVYDKAGNQFTTSIKVNVDNTPPTVSIASPQNGTTVSGTVTINFTANDANTLSWVLFIDNAQITIYPQRTYQWDTTKVVDGNHTIRIVATDIAGNSNEQTITVKTANAAPAYITIASYASAAILGLALGALAVWTLLRRRQISSKPAV